MSWLLLNFLASSSRWLSEVCIGKIAKLNACIVSQAFLAAQVSRI
jgi:hypothetical protein